MLATLLESKQTLSFETFRKRSEYDYVRITVYRYVLACKLINNYENYQESDVAQRAIAFHLEYCLKHRYSGTSCLIIVP